MLYGGLHGFGHCLFFFIWLCAPASRQLPWLVIQPTLARNLVRFKADTTSCSALLEYLWA
jgi:hypothetical protein